MPRRPKVGELEVWKQLGSATEEAPIRTFKDAKLIQIALIRPSPDQPRRSYDAGALRELADSIRERGLLQPIVVRPEGAEGEAFVIIAGQRRYEACKLIGWEEIPAIVREANEQEALEESLIENVQREDINPVEEAQCYRRLMDEHNYSIRDMAAKVHKSVGYLHGRLELLEHSDIAASVGGAQIGVFEARELAKIEDEALRRELTEKVASGELDRAALKREVRNLTGKSEQLPLLDAEAISRRWSRFRKDLEALDTSKLASEDRRKARQVLEEMRQTIEQMLSQIE